MIVLLLAVRDTGTRYIPIPVLHTPAGAVFSETQAINEGAAARYAEAPAAKAYRSHTGHRHRHRALLDSHERPVPHFRSPLLFGELEAE